MAEQPNSPALGPVPRRRAPLSSWFSHRGPGTAAAVALLTSLVLLRVYPLGAFLDGSAGTLPRVVFLLLGPLALLGTALLVLRAQPRPRPAPAWYAALYAAPCLLVWGAWLAAFYPALMSVDSIVQWDEMMRAEFTDAHPPFSTMLLWLLTRAWLSPAAIALPQLVALAAAHAWGMLVAQRMGAPRPALLALTAFTALHPLNGAFAITLWKDVPYSTALLWLSIACARIVASRGRWLEGRRAQLTVVVALLLVVLLRHNGIAPAVLTTAAAFLLFRRHWRPLLAATLATVLLLAVIYGPLFSAVGVKPGRSDIKSLPYMHYIAAALVAGREIPKPHRWVVERVMPLEVWRAGFVPYVADPLILMPECRKGFLERNTGKLKRAWLAVVLHYPGVALSYRLRMASQTWRLSEFRDTLTLVAWDGIHPNSYGLATDSRWPWLHERLRELMFRIDLLSFQAAKTKWFFSRTALFFYLCLFFAALLVLRTWRLSWLLVLLPTAANQLSVFVFAPSQDTRYVYAPLLLAPLLAALSLGAGAAAGDEEAAPGLVSSGTSRNLAIARR